MNTIDEFFSAIKKISNNNELNIEETRKLISEINAFLFTNYDGIGTVKTLGGVTEEYFSDFHKYWSEHYSEVLAATIDDIACEQVADSLHLVFLKDKSVFSEIYDTYGLSKKEICRVRMLTANQDFRGSRNFKDFAKIFDSDKSIFDEKNIYNNPETFIKNIGITDLSQGDKRINYARSIAKFCLDMKCEPYDVISKFNNNVYDLKKSLMEFNSSGYGNKKADMFIRDMVVLKIWENVTGFEKINVASDINTIKVALRSGIIKTSIPLLSSFLDIFCYQYSHIEDMSAKGWRRVWEIWSSKYPAETIMSPCLLDYFIYNVIGKQFCKEILYEYEGDDCKHQFFWHSPKNKTCQVCYQNGVLDKRAHLFKRAMPCTSKDGHIAIRKTSFCISNPNFTQLTECPFKKICVPQKTTDLMPPKSISIYGQTGWTTAYAKKGKGGGGLMS